MEDLSFSDKYIMEKREELVLQVLALFGINNFIEKQYISFADLNDREILSQLRNMIPALRTVFQIARNRALSYTSWDSSKHPGLNLLRQILKEIGYKLSIINEFRGTLEIKDKKKKIYNTKYIIVKLDEPTEDNQDELCKIVEEKKNFTNAVPLKKSDQTITMGLN
jgi:hypothetical protein